MTIVLTGDVHHHIPSSDRRYAEESEAALGAEYARIAERHGLKITLFVTGRALREDAADAAPLARMDMVEVGGHGWDAFHPSWLYRGLSRLTGSPHGYRRWQRRGIARTRAAIESFSGRPPRSWRNHAYVHDANTPVLLAAAGLTAWSDDVDPARTHPYVHESGLVVLPLNTLPDHENLYHGDLTPRSLADGRRALHPDEWTAHVLDSVAALVAAGGVATILAHPLCMKVVDDWATFDALCAGLARYESLFATEAAERSLAHS